MRTRTWSTDFKWLVHLSLFLLCTSDSVRYACAFNFEFSPPGQCDPLNISWTGPATPPFFLLIAPLFRNFLNISLPSSVYDAETQTGSFSTQLSFPENQKFILAMSDANGFGSGGISSVLTTGASVTGSVCDTSLDAVPAFTFALPDSLQQCSEFLFSGYSNSTQPNTIRGLIPLGQAVTLVTDPKTDDFTWQANVASGSSMVFIITDSLGRGGGTSDLETVAESSNAACLNEQSPHSTASSATQMSATQTATSQSSATANPQSAKSGVNAGVIAGIVVGVAAVLLLGILLAVFLVRRRDRHKQSSEYGSASQVVQFQNAPFSINASNMASVVPTPYQGSQQSADFSNHAYPYSSPSTQRRLSQSHSSPSGYDYQQGAYQYPTSMSASDSHSARVTSMLPNPHSQSQRASRSDFRYLGSQSDSSSSTASGYLLNPSTNTDPRQPPPEMPAGNNSVSKAPPSQSKTRLILHTDVEDPVEPVEERVLELPPQYSDRRDPPTAPVPSQLSSGKQMATYP